MESEKKREGLITRSILIVGQVEREPPYFMAGNYAVHFDP